MAFHKSVAKERSTYETFRAVREILLTEVGNTLNYDSWSDDYKVKSIKNVVDDVKKWKGCSAGLDPNGMSAEELTDLGFRRWSETTELRLIPNWMFPFLKEDIVTTDISGNLLNSREAIGDDHRFGCLAAGVFPFPFSHTEPTAG